MKRVYFVRHGKSDWSDSSLSDHDRPLAPRGKRDAPRMARRLVHTQARVDGLLSSTARRAHRTARVFAEAYGIPPREIRTDEQLYLAGPNTIARAVRALPPGWDTVLLFGHNPGYTDLANRFRHPEPIDNVPTCGIVGTECDVSSWADWSPAAARRILFYYPKQQL